MTVAFIFESDTLTQEQYDGVMAAMGFGDAGSNLATAVGAVAHMAGPRADGGWRVIDVWESEEAANAFYSSDLFAPVREATEGSGITSTPWAIHRIDS
jgi:hypothetical protein